MGGDVETHLFSCLDHISLDRALHEGAETSQGVKVKQICVLSF